MRTPKKNPIEAWVDELSGRAGLRPLPAADPTSEPKPETTERPRADAELDADYAYLTVRAGALSVVNRAGAQLVRVCPECHGDIEGNFAVFVPRQNDTPEFRAALELLQIIYPVVARRYPLSLLARCEHVREAR